MKRTLLIGAAALATALVVAMPASARLGTAPASTLAVQDDAVVLVKGGRGHGHGWGRGGRGHHYGWHRGRGHHYGWRHRHHRRHW
jgi:hypothetical protein